MATMASCDQLSKLSFVGHLQFCSLCETSTEVPSGQAAFTRHNTIYFRNKKCQRSRYDRPLADILLQRYQFFVPTWLAFTWLLFDPVRVIYQAESLFAFPSSVSGEPLQPDKTWICCFTDPPSVT